MAKLCATFENAVGALLPATNNEDDSLVSYWNPHLLADVGHGMESVPNAAAIEERNVTVSMCVREELIGNFRRNPVKSFSTKRSVAAFNGRIDHLFLTSQVEPKLLLRRVGRSPTESSWILPSNNLIVCRPCGNVAGRPPNFQEKDSPCICAALNSSHGRPCTPRVSPVVLPKISPLSCFVSVPMVVLMIWLYRLYLWSLLPKLIVSPQN